MDESVKLWSEIDDSLEAQHTYTGHTLGVISVAVDASNTYAASSALDSFIRVWNLKDNSTKAVIETQPSETWTIAFMSDGTGGGPLLLAAAGEAAVFPVRNLITATLFLCHQVAGLPPFSVPAS